MKIPFLINSKFLAILIFLFSIPAAVRADDDENEDFYFYLADILCSISSMCVCSRVICTRVDADKRSIINFSINLISVISSVFGLILGRGRTIKAAVQGLITIILWILPSILMLLDHNNEKFEVGNEILTSHINFLNITRLYLFSGAGREMLTYIEISKIVSSLLGICKYLPNQLLLIVLFSLECIILFFRTNDFTIRFILIASSISF
ncbi:unnamed protein product [Rhizophagus irregularis]|nr:unnamed protein product [Rhizophagus irregularis]